MSGVSPVGPRRRFDRMESKGSTTVPEDLSTFFDQMREAYRAGDFEGMKVISTNIVNYLNLPKVKEQLKQICPRDKGDALAAAIDRFIQADKRIQNQGKAPVGFPLNADLKDPTFGPFISAVKENMYAQIGHRDCLQFLLHLLDPVHYPPPHNMQSGG